MIKLLCKVFGHHTVGGWWGDVPYCTPRLGAIDNIGRIHGMLWHECSRCGEAYIAARIHINDPEILQAIGRYGEPRDFAVIEAAKPVSRFAA